MPLEWPVQQEQIRKAAKMANEDQKALMEDKAICVNLECRKKYDIKYKRGDGLLKGYCPDCVFDEYNWLINE